MTEKANAQKEEEKRLGKEGPLAKKKKPIKLER